MACSSFPFLVLFLRALGAAFLEVLTLALARGFTPRVASWQSSFSKEAKRDFLCFRSF